MYYLNKNNNYHVVASATMATIFTLAIIFPSSMITIPVQASPMDGNTTTATTTTTLPSSGIELSAQPIWDEEAITTGVTQINETHSLVTFIGNGTMTVPDTEETINMTNNGTGLVSPVPGYTDTVSAYGREYVFSSEDDDDTTAITFYEIIRYDPTTFEGKGLVIAVFDNNATGSLAPFNGMLVVGTHEEDPSTPATIILWEWQGGIPLPPLPTTTMEESTSSPTNTTTITIDASAIDTNATMANEEEQQQQTTPTIPAPLLE
jgi:hypothetical protein